MSNARIPAITASLTPTFDAARQVEGLHVSLSIEGLSRRAGDAVVSFPTNLARRTSISPGTAEWRASDDLGDLPISIGNDSSYEWVAQRDTAGQVNFSYVANPSLDGRLVGHAAAASDLRLDHGGLIGSGFSFIPIPSGTEVYNITVEWDLDGAPKGTRAVWTFGEGPKPIEKIGPASLLSDSVYMVGPIRSDSGSTSNPNTISDYYGYYWFGSLPSNIEVIKDIHHAFFLKVSDFFNDTPLASNPYRHFVRNTTPVKSFGGTSFVRSHIFDYDDQITQAQDYDLVRRMAYEMIHSFLGPSLADPSIDWLFEGIKHALSIYLPFRPPNQFRTGHYFQSTLSMHCMKYYTSPLVHVPHDEVLARASAGDAYAMELLGIRAWAFVIGTDFAARKLVAKTKPPQRPIEDLAIKPLAVRKRDGKSHGIGDWIDLLTPLMGPDARDRYEYMRSGKVITLPVEVFGAKSHRLVQVDEETFDLGMDRQAFEEGLVQGLKPGSRAEKAGLREGDAISWSSHLWRCVEDFNAEVEVVVGREGRDEKIKFWPRAFEKAASWRMIKVEEA